MCSVLYLWPRTRSLTLDRFAGASAEIGVLFTGLALVTGMLWGRPTWGVFWTWDARLTSTALLFLLFLGYLAIRRLPAPPEQRAKRAAIAGLIAFIDVPIVHLSVEWWRSLHQDATVARRDLDAQLDGTMLFTLFLVAGRLHPDLRVAAAAPSAPALAGGPQGDAVARPGHRRPPRRGGRRPVTSPAGVLQP